jgi:hypothetical protein
MRKQNIHEVYKNSGLGKWFHDESSNSTPGWERYDSQGNVSGECGDAKKGEAYSACLSKQKAAKLGKEGRASFVKRKRATQSKAGRGKKGSGKKGKKPVFVKTGASKMEECVQCQNQYDVINFITEGLDLLFEGKNKPKQPKKWNSCIAAAKKKFDVYPSAYANAWAAKCYKGKGGGWKKTVKEETELLNELHPETYANYINKASTARDVISSVVSNMNATDSYYPLSSEQQKKRASLEALHDKRVKGTERAVKLLTKQAKANKPVTPMQENTTETRKEEPKAFEKPPIKDGDRYTSDMDDIKNRTKFIRLGNRSILNESFKAAAIRLIEVRNKQAKKKPLFTPRGVPQQQTSKTFYGGGAGKSGSENTIRRREGKRQAEQDQN